MSQSLGSPICLAYIMFVLQMYYTGYTELHSSLCHENKVNRAPCQIRPQKPITFPLGIHLVEHLPTKQD